MARTHNTLKKLTILDVLHNTLCTMDTQWKGTVSRSKIKNSQQMLHIVSELEAVISRSYSMHAAMPSLSLLSHCAFRLYIIFIQIEWLRRRLTATASAPTYIYICKSFEPNARARISNVCIILLFMNILVLSHFAWTVYILHLVFSYLQLLIMYVRANALKLYKLSGHGRLLSLSLAWAWSER